MAVGLSEAATKQVKQLKTEQNLPDTVSFIPSPARVH